MERETAAALELSRRRAKQAAGAIRKAVGLLARIDDGHDHLGSLEVRGLEDLDRVRDALEWALAERETVEVVLLAATRRRQTTRHGP